VNGTALSLWRQGATRAAILDFVARVTRTGSRDYVPPESRVAVFDNDGTLWCEKPLPIQADFLLRHIGEQAERDPSLRDKQPWKAVWERDHKWLSDVIIKHYRGDDGDLRVMGAALLHAYEGETTDSYAEKASEFLHASQNPVLKRPYLKTAYAPMVLEVQVLWPGDAGGNGLLRRVIYQMPFGRRGAALELVSEVEEARGYTYKMIGREPGNDRGVTASTTARAHAHDRR